MITSHEKAEIGQGLVVEVNWNKEVTPCKKMRLIDKNTKTEYIIDRGDFFGMMFMFADPDQQVEMIPTISTEVRSVRTMLKIKAKKDIKKGEFIVVPHEYFVPVTESSRFDKIK